MNTSDLRKIDNLIKKRLKNVATKDGLKKFATRNDLERFATKNDLKNVATKDDLKRFTTKDDLAVLQKTFKNDLDDAVVQIIEIVDKNKADKEIVRQLEERVKAIENN